MEEPILTKFLKSAGLRSAHLRTEHPQSDIFSLHITPINLPSSEDSGDLQKAWVQFHCFGFYELIAATAPRSSTPHMFMPRVVSGLSSRDKSSGICPPRSALQSNIPEPNHVNFDKALAEHRTERGSARTSDELKSQKYRFYPVNSLSLSLSGAIHHLFFVPLNEYDLRNGLRHSAGVPFCNSFVTAPG